MQLRLAATDICYRERRRVSQGSGSMPRANLSLLRQISYRVRCRGRLRLSCPAAGSTGRRRWKPRNGPCGSTSLQDNLGSRIEYWSVHLPADTRRARFNLLLLDRAGRPNRIREIHEEPTSTAAGSLCRGAFGESTWIFLPSNARRQRDCAGLDLLPDDSGSAETPLAGAFHGFLSTPAISEMQSDIEGAGHGSCMGR